MPKRKKSGWEYWRKVIQEWRGSGLSQRRFCEDRGISFSSFCYWRRRLREEGEGESSSPFIPVEIRPLARSPYPTPYEVRLESGIRIRVPFDFDSDSLLRLIGLLQGEQC